MASKFIDTALRGLATSLHLISGVYFFLGYTDGSMEESQCQGKEKAVLSEVRVRRKFPTISTPWRHSGLQMGDALGPLVTAKQLPLGSSDSEVDKHTRYVCQPALENVYMFSRQTHAA